MNRWSCRMLMLAVVCLVPTSPASAAPQDEEVPMRLARQTLPEFLAEWSRQTGQTYCYPAWLPDSPVVVAEPGKTKSLAAVLRPLGWEAQPFKGGVAVARVNDDRLVPLHRTVLWTSDDVDARRSAAHELGKLSVPKAIPALLKGLTDENASVRFHCLEALWAIEADFEMRRLPGRVSMMRVAGLDPDPLVRTASGSLDDRARRMWRFSVDLLGRAGADAVRPLALDALKAANQDPRVYLVAARALRETAKPEDAKPLAAFVEAIGDTAARREAVGALARLGGAGLDVPKAALGRDADLACLACEALGYVDAAESVDPLVAALARSDVDRATLAAEALGRLTQASAEKALVQALTSNADWRRAAAARGLGLPSRTRTKATSAALAKAAEDESPLVRAAVAAAMPACEPQTALKTLLALSEDKDAQVRLAAVRGLRTLGGRAALKRLKELMTDRDPTVAHDATRGVGWLGGKAEAEMLAKIATDYSLGRDRPEAAVMALSDLVDPEAREVAVQALIQAMENPQQCPHAVGRAATKIVDARLLPGLLKIQKDLKAGGNLRVDVMDAIAAVGTEEAVEAMIKNWWEYHNMPRYQGGRALRDNVHQPVVLNTLIGMLSRSGEPRSAATFCLVNSRDPRAIDALIRVLKVDKGGVIGAGTVLGLIADPAATAALLEAAQNPEHGGRFVAGRALRMRDLSWQSAVKEALVKLYGWRDDGTPPPIAEQEPNSWVLRHWARDYDDFTHSSLTYESGVTMDTRRGRLVHWGAHGRRYDVPQTAETWIYDPAANTWTEGGADNLPPGTCCTREVCYDSVNDRVLVTKGGGGGHGWLSIKEQTLRRSLPWAYDPETDRWIAMKPTSVPPFAAWPVNAFDRRCGVLVTFSTGTQPPAAFTYDTWTNQWQRPTPEGPVPEAKGYGHMMAYDRRRGRILVGGRGLFWACDLAAGTWTDLTAKDLPERFSPMIYDSVNDVVLAFNAGSRGTAVYAYDPQKKTWTTHTTTGMQPDYSEWDAAFDAQRNVAFVCGGEVSSNPGSPNCRETWTYRFGPGRGETPLDPPVAAECLLAAGRAKITWTAPGDDRVTGYTVYRAKGERTWGVDFQKLTRQPIQVTAFDDPTDLERGQAYVYLVRSVNAKGEESAEPAIARTQPAVPTDVVATFNAKGLARVTWRPSPSKDVVGYHVYRAPVEPGGLYGFNPIEAVGTFAKITGDLVKGAEFVDPEKPEPGERGWAFAPRAYLVRAINSLGVESGPSPWAVTVPAAVERIRARRREDGAVVVTWAKSPNPDVVGYVVYRMDNWRNDMVTRVNEVPVTGTLLVDPEGRPTGERQRYWVTAVDRFGQEGPSGTGPWSFNRS